MNKRDGWCTWSPIGGYLIDTMAYTRKDAIAAFERDVCLPWRKYRQRGYQCRPVRLECTALEEAMARESGDA